MSAIASFALRLAACTLIAGAVLAPSMAFADVEDRLYDFTDAYYRQNGVDPTRIEGRMQPGPIAVEDEPNFTFQRNVRALLTLPAYDHSGDPNYFTVLGGIADTAFTPNAAGRRTREIANRSPEYLFPRRGTDPVGLGAFRQSVILDMRHGYFSNNKLGLWIHVWVSYTNKALNTAAGKRALDDLARRNGRDLDDTPIIKTVSEIEDLFAKGFISKRVRPLADPLRYAICPVIEDPTDGGVAPDQFLAFTTKDDGTPLEPEFVADFESLQNTGDHAD